MQSLWQPEGDKPEKGSLMVILHGRGDSVEGFSRFKSELAIPGLSVLLLNAPDPYYDGFSWYDLPPNQLPGIIRSRNLLRSTFDQIFKWGFSPERTFLFGFSQGCLMTLEFGGRYEKCLAGYIGVSGYCYDPALLISEADKAVMKGDWLITHGTTDSVLDCKKTRDQMTDLKAAGFNLEFKEYEKDHTIDPKKELPMIREWITQRLVCS